VKVGGSVVGGAVVKVGGSVVGGAVVGLSQSQLWGFLIWPGPHFGRHLPPHSSQSLLKHSQVQVS
jgi:hypothetical protein